MLVLILTVLTATGCVEQSIKMVNVQAAETATPYVVETPEASLTAEPTSIPLEVPIITGEDFAFDALGVPILDISTHYSKYYLEFSSIRVYDYGSSSYMDAQCFNAFSMDLEGEARIAFYGDDGKLYGVGNILTAEGNLILPTGVDTPIYAEIFAERPLSELTYEIEIITPFMPIGG